MTQSQPDQGMSIDDLVKAINEDADALGQDHLKKNPPPSAQTSKKASIDWLERYISAVVVDWTPEDRKELADRLYKMLIILRALA